MKRLGILLGMGAMVAMTACSGDRTVTVSAAAATPAAVKQPATSVERADVFQASGPLVVENQVDVAAQREGVVAKILLDVGARVRKGQVLAQLDDRQLTADRDAAQAKVKSLEADFQHWKALDKVRHSDLARSEAMWKAQLITAQQLEHDRYSAVATEYEIQRQEQDLKNAQNSLRSVELELGKTRILAPFDGVVARRYVREGQKIALNDRLFWITATAPLNVKFTLPQEFAGKVKAGDAVQVSTSFDPAATHAAKITLVSPVVDPASGTIELQAQVVGEPKDLRPGMTVNVSVKPQ